MCVSKITTGKSNTLSCHIKGKRESVLLQKAKSESYLMTNSNFGLKIYYSLFFINDITKAIVRLFVY